MASGDATQTVQAAAATQTAQAAGDGGGSPGAKDAGQGTSEEKGPPHVFDKKHYLIVNSVIRDESEYSHKLEQLPFNENPTVNLMGDHLLSVVIAARKTRLAIHLIRKIKDPEHLGAPNYDGDTALHVAATVGDCQVAEALFESRDDLVRVPNKKGETPLHKAALYGQRDMFWCLVRHGGSSLKARKEDGATVLHCAIMGNAPVLALEIAIEDAQLITSRNDAALTPLQLMVTIPEAFRSQMVLGSLESFLYDWIPLENNSSKTSQRDEEAARGSSNHVHVRKLKREEAALLEDEEDKETLRSRLPSNYSTLFDLLELLCIPGRWIQVILFKMLKPLSPTIQRLEKQKKNHKEAMELVEHLARKDYFDFLDKGLTHPSAAGVVSPPFSEFSTTPPPMPDGDPQNGSTTESGTPGPLTTHQDSSRADDAQQKVILKFVEKLAKFLTPAKKDEAETPAARAVKELIQSAQKALEALSPTSETMRWNESPLILGARLGLHDFVGRILQVCPESATYHARTNKKNVLQEAIEHGSRKIVEAIHNKTLGHNPILPSWLLSTIDEDTKNTILHIASGKPRDAGNDSVQMQDELQWFERVKGMVPKELVYSRNRDEKTAQEMFTENHKEMLESNKKELMEMGKTCSGLVAAVVFASSFSIPGEKDPKTGNPIYFNRLPFKIFSHAYVIGFACAATALVLFMSLIISPYKEQQFRRAIPTKYFFACLSFALAIAGFLVSFTCNLFLQIYGGQKAETKDIVPLILELTVFPTVCFLVLLYRGCSFFPSFVRRLWS